MDGVALASAIIMPRRVFNQHLSTTRTGSHLVIQFVLGRYDHNEITCESGNSWTLLGEIIYNNNSMSKICSFFKNKFGYNNEFFSKAKKPARVSSADTRRHPRKGAKGLVWSSHRNQRGIHQTTSSQIVWWRLYDDPPVFGLWIIYCCCTYDTNEPGWL